MDLHCYEDGFVDNLLDLRCRETMLEHSSGPIPAEELMDDENVTDNFEYSSVRSFLQRSESLKFNEPANSSLCSKYADRMDPIGGVPAEWLMCDDDAENNVGQLFPTTSSSSVSSYVTTSVSNTSAACEQEHRLRSEVEWLNYKICQKLIKKKMKELNEEKSRMLHYYSEISALMSVYEKHKERLKKRQRRKAARKRMKEAKRRFLSEFFNRPFEVTKACERSVGVLEGKSKIVESRLQRTIRLTSRRIENCRRVYKRYKSAYYNTKEDNVIPRSRSMSDISNSSSDGSESKGKGHIDIFALSKIVAEEMKTMSEVGYLDPC